MNRQLLFWTPRILAVLNAAFLSLFALDVFDQSASLRQIVAELAIHLIPAALILVLLALSFVWPRLAGTLFLLAGLGYCFMTGFRLDWILVIAGPLFLIGVLFLIARPPRTTERA